jgi:hypothetical protein
VTLSVSVVPPTLCSIKVHHGAKRPLEGAGLGISRGLFGEITWRWMVPLSATRGRWSADVSCGGSGSLHTSFLVR